MANEIEKIMTLFNHDEVGIYTTKLLLIKTGLTENQAKKLITQNLIQSVTN